MRKKIFYINWSRKNKYYKNGRAKRKAFEKAWEKHRCKKRTNILKELLKCLSNT